MAGSLAGSQQVSPAIYLTKRHILYVKCKVTWRICVPTGQPGGRRQLHRRPRRRKHGRDGWLRATQCLHCSPGAPEYLCARSASMYRFIPVMRAVLVEETQGNSNGFLIRFLSSVSFGSAKTTTDRWHPAPGGSPSTARPRQSY